MTQIRFYPMRGGLDLITAPIQRQGGSVIDGFNYEPRPEGYTRIRGFERINGTGLSSELGDTHRASILPPPGSGQLRGAWDLNGIEYAFRDTEDGTECKLYKTSPSGWINVPLGHQIRFKNGTGPFDEGDTLTGSSSGASATIERTLIKSGDPTTSDAEGRFILSGLTDSFIDGENLQINSSTVAISESESEAITLSPGGRYEFINHNFYGGSSTYRMYGVDGVNHAFEFDGEIYVPIETGTEEDKPTHLTNSLNNLVLSFRGGSLQISEAGEPTSFNGILGAAEIGLGDDITGFVTGFAGAVIIYTRNRTAVLYGNVLGNLSSDTRLEIVNEQSGAIEWSAQLVISPLSLDDAGIREVGATQSFGNFSPSLRSNPIRPILERLKRDNVQLTATMAVRQFSQYWMFFDNGYGLVLSRETGEFQFMPIDLGMVVRQAYSIDSREDGTDEKLLLISDDGHLYRYGSGNSFDGAPINAFLRLAFNSMGSPYQRKRFKKATLELTTPAAINLGITADFSYGDPELTSVPQQGFNVVGGGGFWDESKWDEFYWSQVEGQAKAYIDGLGTNISITVQHQSNNEKAHTIHGISYLYSLRGIER